MPGDATIPLPVVAVPANTLDAELYTNQSSTTVDRERIASVPGTPTLCQTTIDNNPISSSGNSVILAGVSLQTIRIYRMLLTVSAPTNIEFLDGSSTVLAGPFSLGANGGIILDHTGEPWFITSAGNAFNINSSAAVTLCCTVWFTQS